MREKTHLPKMIASQIVMDIVNNKLVPGSKVIEEKYANTFGTSRGPIREALYMLETEGLIERIPKRGAFVKKYNKQDLCDLFEVRIALEIMSIRRLKYPLPENKINEIDRIIEAMYTANQEEYSILNNDFHYKILCLSENEIFKNFYSRLGAPLIALQKFVLETPENIQHSLQEHQLLWKAIKERKLNIAKAVLEDHMESGKKRFLMGIEKKTG
ncbi:GntR family transcriptional regulator [Mesobacillus maritimus]|nr:GntR family transcriptional regulator [Mesobacillus maritimus]MCM3668675.1 GntR family transcriptional regulator [Mesobacillus maritimus]